VSATHEVKSWPKFFEPILRGVRTHELRVNDRNYQVGDWMLLREYDPEISQYTGRDTFVAITSVTSAGEPCAVSADALHPSYCILSVALR